MNSRVSDIIYAMSRPTIREGYDTSFLVRCRAEEKRLMERARWYSEGKLKGERLPFNEWARQTLLAAAEKAGRAMGEIK
jgi:hypothetical protein